MQQTSGGCFFSKVKSLSLAVSYSISEDSALAYLIHLAALMLAFEEKKKHYIFSPGVAKELPCRWPQRQRSVSLQVFQRGPRLKVDTDIENCWSGSPCETTQA